MKQKLPEQLEMYETTKLGISNGLYYLVTKVPGGFIYSYSGTGSVFVPDKIDEDTHE